MKTWSNWGFYKGTVEPSKDLQIAVELAKKHEWLSLTAYCDTLKYVWTKYIRDCRGRKTDRWSIWYWTQSVKGETITKIEAEEKMMQYFQNIQKEVAYKCYNDQEKWAMLDFMYNSGRFTKHNTTWIPFVTYVKRCDKKTVNSFLYPWNYTSKWLKKRRNSEYIAFNSNKL